MIQLKSVSTCTLIIQSKFMTKKKSNFEDKWLTRYDCGNKKKTKGNWDFQCFFLLFTLWGKNNGNGSYEELNVCYAIGYVYLMV